MTLVDGAPSRHRWPREPLADAMGRARGARRIPGRAAPDAQRRGGQVGCATAGLRAIAARGPHSRSWSVRCHCWSSGPVLGPLAAGHGLRDHHPYLGQCPPGGPLRGAHRPRTRAPRRTSRPRPRPGSTRWTRTTPPQSRTSRSDHGAYLEYLPGMTIPHRHSRYVADTRITLPAGCDDAAVRDRDARSHASRAGRAVRVRRLLVDRQRRASRRTAACSRRSCSSSPPRGRCAQPVRWAASRVRHPVRAHGSCPRRRRSWTATTPVRRRDAASFPAPPVCRTTRASCSGSWAQGRRPSGGASGSSGASSAGGHGASLPDAFLWE